MLKLLNVQDMPCMYIQSTHIPSCLNNPPFASSATNLCWGFLLMHAYRYVIH